MSQEYIELTVKIPVKYKKIIDFLESLDAELGMDFKDHLAKEIIASLQNDFSSGGEGIIVLIAGKLEGWLGLNG